MTQSRDLNRFIVRFPKGMREIVAKQAKRNGRSMNAEIVYRLANHAEELSTVLAEIRALAKVVESSATNKNMRFLSATDKARLASLIAARAMQRMPKP